MKVQITHPRRLNEAEVQGLEQVSDNLHEDGQLLAATLVAGAAHQLRTAGQGLPPTRQGDGHPDFKVNLLLDAEEVCEVLDGLDVTKEPELWAVVERLKEACRQTRKAAEGRP